MTKIDLRDTENTGYIESKTGMDCSDASNGKDNLSDSSSSSEESISSDAEPLLVGDTIGYYHPMAVWGTKRSECQSKIISIDTTQRTYR